MLGIEETFLLVISIELEELVPLLDSLAHSQLHRRMAIFLCLRVLELPHILEVYPLNQLYSCQALFLLHSCEVGVDESFGIGMLPDIAL
jgi:hypothetical protein